MTQFMRHLMVASLSSTLLIIFLVGLKKPILKYMGATWNYYLWFIIFIPWAIVWIPWYYFPAHFIKLFFNIYSLVEPINQMLTVGLSHVTNVPKVFFISNQICYWLFFSKVFFIIWLTGVLICLLYTLVSHFRFIFLLKQNSRSLTLKEQEIVISHLAMLGYRSLPRFFLTTIVTSPMVCHLLKPTIYLPTNFFQHYNVSEQRYILKHEYVHWRRLDVATNAAMLMLGFINWFNPIILFAYHSFRSAQELSCDATICSSLSLKEKKGYGYALVKTATNNATYTSPVNCWWSRTSGLKERCQMLKFHRLRQWQAIVGIGGLILTGCMAVAAPNLENKDGLLFHSISDNYKKHSSKFFITLFNSTHLSNPLHYLVLDQENKRVIKESLLAAGDDEGEFIAIDYPQGKKIKIILEDSLDHLIWSELITFNVNRLDTKSNIEFIDSSYALSTHMYSPIKAISFDIRKK